MMYIVLTVEQFKYDRIGEGHTLPTERLYTEYSLPHMVRKAVQYAEGVGIDEFYIGEYDLVEGVQTMMTYWYVIKDSIGWRYKEKRGKPRRLL